MRPLLIALIACTAGAQVFQSYEWKADVAPSADPRSAFWRDVPGLVIESDFFGQPVANHRTEVRSRWTPSHLHLMYICHYEDLNLKPDAFTTTAETDRLWNWDVAEAFLGSDFRDIARYKEFQVSPRGEWVDLDIDRSPQKRGEGVKWNSGFAVKARIDQKAKVWYGEMKIPFSSIMAVPAARGVRLRAGLYRLAGRDADRKYLSWQATGARSFHVPERFGILELTGPSAPR